MEAVRNACKVPSENGFHTKSKLLRSKYHNAEEDWNHNSKFSVTFQQWKELFVFFPLYLRWQQSLDLENNLSCRESVPTVFPPSLSRGTAWTVIPREEASQAGPDRSSVRPCTRTQSLHLRSISAAQSHRRSEPSGRIETGGLEQPGHWADSGDVSHNVSCAVWKMYWGLTPSGTKLLFDVSVTRMWWNRSVILLETKCVP